MALESDAASETHGLASPPAAPLITHPSHSGASAGPSRPAADPSGRVAGSSSKHKRRQKNKKETAALMALHANAAKRAVDMSRKQDSVEKILMTLHSYKLEIDTALKPPGDETPEEIARRRACMIQLRFMTASYLSLAREKVQTDRDEVERLIFQGNIPYSLSCTLLGVCSMTMAETREVLSKLIKAKAAFPSKKTKAQQWRFDNVTRVQQLIMMRRETWKQNQQKAFDPKFLDQRLTSLARIDHQLGVDRAKGTEEKRLWTQLAPEIAAHVGTSSSHSLLESLKAALRDTYEANPISIRKAICEGRMSPEHAVDVLNLPSMSLPMLRLLSEVLSVALTSLDQVLEQVIAQGEEPSRSITARRFNVAKLIPLVNTYVRRAQDAQRQAESAQKKAEAAKAKVLAELLTDEKTTAQVRDGNLKSQKKKPKVKANKKKDRQA